MSEVEKMYSNAGIKKEAIPCPAKYYGYDCTRNNWDDEDCSCDIEVYPPFTAEKQLELIKFLCTKRYIDITFTPEKEYYIFAYFVGCGFDKNFDEALAMFVNQYWNELSEEERKQIKEILE